MNLGLEAMIIGMALYFGLSEIASAIRTRQIHVDLTTPITLRHMDAGNEEARHD